MMVAFVAGVALAAAFQCADGAPPPCRSARAAGAPRMSVAVLDFRNLSNDSADAWLGQGIAGELASRLGQVGRLVVASREAVRRVPNAATMRLAEVGRALNAAYLLGGTVQRSGARLRVTVELLRAATGAQVWTGQFDRSESDLLAVQESVSTAVATAVAGALLPAERTTLARVPTRNAEAYAKYVRGRALLLAWPESADGLRLLEQAIALDSSFADAWAEAARAHLSQYWNYLDRSAWRLERARTAANRALALAPEAASSHLAMGYFHYFGERDYAQAMLQFSAVLAREPNNALVHAALANVARRKGDWPAAVTSRLRVLALDPSNAMEYDELGTTYALMRRFDEAERAFARATALAAPRLGSVYALAGFFARDGSSRRAPDRVAAVASDVPSLASRMLKNPALVGTLVRMSAEIQAAVLLGAPPTDTQARAGFFLAVATSLTRQGRPLEAAPVYDSVRVMATRLIEAMPYDEGFHTLLASALAGLGLCDDALREGERATELVPVENDAITGVELVQRLAEIEAQCGRWDQAAVRLEFLLSRPSGVTRALIREDPAWIPLHETPRYEKIIAGH